MEKDLLNIEMRELYGSWIVTSFSILALISGLFFGVVYSVLTGVLVFVAIGTIGAALFIEKRKKDANRNKNENGSH